mgnify:CR=1 FL=1|tara:strand:+ start:414 stop:680 length:267 start_codon:yes stop_codon:yes gene_type:complete
MNSNVSIFNSEQLSMMSFLELLNLKDKFQTLKKNCSLAVKQCVILNLTGDAEFYRNDVIVCKTNLTLIEDAFRQLNKNVMSNKGFSIN